MSDYSRQQDFSTKTGTIIYGSEVDDEFDAVLTAVNSKVDESREGSANGIATLGAGALIPVGISGTATSGGGQVPEATATALGAVELATSAEALALADASRVITCATLNSVIEAMPGTGLAEAAGVLSVDLNELGTETTIAAGDFLAMVDITDSGSGKITFANLEATLAIANLSDYDANKYVDHTGVTLTAGAGLTGGGTIAASRSFAVGAGSGITVNADDIEVDLTGLTAMTGATLAGADLFLVYDASAAVNKKMAYQDAGIPIVDDATTAPFTTADLTYANKWYSCNNASAISAVIPANASVAYPVGTTFWFYQAGAGQVTVSVTTDTLRSPNGAKTAGQYSLIAVTKVASTEWVVTGDTTT